MADAVSGFFARPVPIFSSEPHDFMPLNGNHSGPHIVYKAGRDGKMRIYKALKPEYRGNPVYETALRKEFEIGYSLYHQNICQTISFLNLPELGNCIEMEWIDGETLESFIERGLSHKECLRLACQICDALSHIHSHQIVHRDLKPSNILVSHNGKNIKLIDFSLSDSDSFMLLKQPAGTLHYAAPELLSSEYAVSDCRCDIWSLGVILKELGLNGRVAAKCCAHLPENRYLDASEVSAMLCKKSVPLRIILYILLTAALCSLSTAFIKKVASEKYFRDATEIISQFSKD